MFSWARTTLSESLYVGSAKKVRVCVRNSALPLQKDFNVGRVDLDGLAVKVEGLLVIFIRKGMAALGKQFLNSRHDSQKEKGMSVDGEQTGETNGGSSMKNVTSL